MPGPVVEQDEWFRDARFWEEFAGVVFNERRIRGTAQEVDQVLALTHDEAPAAILDVCCGPGRHALELARRGFRVTGVDIMARHVEQGRAQAGREGLEVEFVEADVRTFRRPGAFDTAICMFTSFGYFEDLEDDRRVLGNVAESLRPGGHFLVQTMGKETVARSLRGRSWYRPEGSPGDIFLIENSVVGAWERVQLDWTIVRADGTRSEASLRIRMFSALEMASLLRDAGFSDVAVFGDLDGRPYDTGANLLVAVARK